MAPSQAYFLRGPTSTSWNLFGSSTSSAARLGAQTRSLFDDAKSWLQETKHRFSFSSSNTSIGSPVVADRKGRRTNVLNRGAAMTQKSTRKQKKKTPARVGLKPKPMRFIAERVKLRRATLPSLSANQHTSGIKASLDSNITDSDETIDIMSDSTTSPPGLDHTFAASKIGGHMIPVPSFRLLNQPKPHNMRPNKKKPQSSKSRILESIADEDYHQRHRSFEAAEKRERKRELELLKYEEYMDKLRREFPGLLPR